MSLFRTLLHDLAAQGHRVPVGTHLVLHEHDDPEAIQADPIRLGKVVLQAAERYETPLAIPLMDLQNEKIALLAPLGLSEAEAESFHFSEAPEVGWFAERIAGPLHPRLQAHTGAVRYVAAEGSRLAIGMCIGPFSLATKLLHDPITPVYLAGAGAAAEDEAEIATLDATLEVARLIVMRSVLAQIEAGAAAVMIAEPAANIAYFSPNQLDADPAVWERYAMRANRDVAEAIRAAGAELIFHCCGELVPRMVRSFGTLRPAMLSLGSSRRLWEDAGEIEPGIVLYGNLPTKRFYSDELTPPDAVREMTCALAAKMREAGHPFILGSECDVLSVIGAEATIKHKVQTMLGCACP